MKRPHSLPSPASCLCFLAAVLAALPVAAQPPESAPPRDRNEAAKSKPAILFDGKSLDGWRIIDQVDFERHGDVGLSEGAAVLNAGKPATGIAWKGDFPRSNYEVSLEAKRIEGSDFFCGITFPVGEEYCTLIVGGWGGGVVGLSNIDGMSAIENETTDYREFELNRWYPIRLRVSDARIEVWLEGKQIVDVDRDGHEFGIWWEQEPARPFGIASWYTSAALKNIRLVRLAPAADRAK